MFKEEHTIKTTKHEDVVLHVCLGMKCVSVKWSKQTEPNRGMPAGTGKNPRTAAEDLAVAGKPEEEFS